MFISGSAKSINTQQYNYIEIKECIIPIENSLYMKDKDSTLKEYLFVSKKEYEFKDNRLDKQVDVMVPRNKQDIIKFKNSLQKVLNPSLGYIKSIDVKNKIKVWYFQEKRNNININKFIYIFLENTIISLTNYEKSEIEYLIDYCLSHRSFSSNSGSLEVR